MSHLNGRFAVKHLGAAVVHLGVLEAHLGAAEARLGVLEARSDVARSGVLVARSDVAHSEPSSVDVNRLGHRLQACDPVPKREQPEQLLLP